MAGMIHCSRSKEFCNDIQKCDEKSGNKSKSAIIILMDLFFSRPVKILRKEIISHRIYGFGANIYGFPEPFIRIENRKICAL